MIQAQQPAIHTCGKDDPCTTTMYYATPTPLYPEYQDFIDKSGKYTATFTDPENKWRCSVTSYIDSNPRNEISSEITSVTITCVKPHEVQKQK